jgi:hypothetical protein
MRAVPLLWWEQICPHRPLPFSLLESNAQDPSFFLLNPTDTDLSSLVHSLPKPYCVLSWKAAASGRHHCLVAIPSHKSRGQLEATGGSLYPQASGLLCHSLLQTQHVPHCRDLQGHCLNLLPSAVSAQPHCCHSPWALSCHKAQDHPCCRPLLSSTSGQGPHRLSSPPSENLSTPS